MTVAVGDVIRVVAEWDIPDGTIAQMVYHYLGVSGTTATESQVLVAAEAALDTAFNQISGSVSTVVTGSTLAILMWDFTLNRFDGVGEGPLIGADGAAAVDMLPHGAAALGKIFTALQRRQSRKYVVGFTESSQVDGTLIGVSVTSLALFLADLDDDLVAGGLTLEYGTFNSDPLSPLFETFSARSGTVQAEAVLAYQRRRRPGTGI